MKDGVFIRKLELVLFQYGFQKCKNDENINFSKIHENDYLIFKVFRDKTADLFLATYNEQYNPCQDISLHEKLLN